DQNPIGKRINIDDRGVDGGPGQAEIVGIVGHVKQWGLDRDESNQLRAQIYLPFMQLTDTQIKLTATGIDVVVRSDGSVPTLFDSLHRASREMSGEQVLYGVQTMDSMIAASLAARRFSMILFGVFAALALLLASVGIYGVLSYLVTHRTNEIGIRIAIGANRGEVLRLILRQGLNMALIGVVMGLVSALALTRLMAGMLFGVSPTDPLTFAGVAILLMLVALGACYFPARRAMRVDPIVALRY
ncbi:MAG TPA: FtsX-like permease family protein, partial [Candidatus Kapabacteria bacterium]